MTDGDLATKAPESDAALHHSVPGDASVQGVTGLGEHCVGDRPTRKLPSPGLGFGATLMICQLLDLRPAVKLPR